MGQYPIRIQICIFAFTTASFFLSNSRKYDQIRVTNSPNLCNLTTGAFGFAYAPEIYIAIDCEADMVVESGFLGSKLHTLVMGQIRKHERNSIVQYLSIFVGHHNAVLFSRLPGSKPKKLSMV